MNKKGFTLLELLIVIGILAILSAVTVLVINPSQLLKRARDSQRLSDVSTMQSAIGLFLTEITTPTIRGNGNIYLTIASSGAVAANTNYASSTYQVINGLGWIPINFTAITGGSPIGGLPTDPINTSNTTEHLYYAYRALDTPLVYEINARMESDFYRLGGGADKENTDGGNAGSIYETGNTTTLMGTTTNGFYRTI